ncbi:hypothetical protein NEHOM01_2120 [Nematocida homosporus]|uniref:uncharacterized protein n=1 Tax=Nematocida homosporus TaxID=1912981 RepID=UPI00222074A0|nr:uncharacterized protein NEHOM01_2120 [Nematocida homosporus]KAI5187358.1 hypothetical protein NEHOM01_2120 [Nematocida homosporus]
MDWLKLVLSQKDRLKRAKSMGDCLDREESCEISLVPMESNYQIPEVILGLKVVPECETYFWQLGVEMAEEEVVGWNERVSRVLEGVMNVEMDFCGPVESRVVVSESEVSQQIKSVLGWV